MKFFSRNNYQCLGFIGLFFLISLELSAAEKTGALDCSCEKTTWQQAFDNAQHVVFGEVKQIQRHGDELATGDFIPMEVFKGAETHITKIAGSGKLGASCRRVLHAGFYIAYGNDSHTAVLNTCSESRQLRPETDLVTTLTELKKYAELKGTITTTRQGNTQHKQKPESETRDWYQMFMDWWESW